MTTDTKFIKWNIGFFFSTWYYFNDTIIFHTYIRQAKRSVARSNELFRFHRRFHRPLTLDLFAKIQQPRRTVSEISIPINSSDYLCVQNEPRITFIGNRHGLWKVVKRKRRCSSIRILRSKEYSTARPFSRRRTKLFAIGSATLELWTSEVGRKNATMNPERSKKRKGKRKAHKSRKIVAIYLDNYVQFMQYSTSTHTRVQREKRRP